VAARRKKRFARVSMRVRVARCGRIDESIELTQSYMHVRVPLARCVVALEIDALDLHRGNGPIDNAYRFQDRTMISKGTVRASEQSGTKR